MKKVLSFVLVLSMILGSFGMAFAAAPADVEGKDYEDAVNVLMELGVIDGYKDGTYRPENIVTRAEMATLIVKAMGLNDYAAGKSNFTDMAGHWADAYAAYAASLGFIAGYADGTFRPNEPVSYDQAITMLVQAVGYKAEYLTGGYPGAFVNQAKALGMLDGVKAGAAGANRGDVATLLFNTLDVDFARYSADGVLQETIVGEADNMMKRLVGKYEVVEKVIDGTEKALINVKDYQGAKVKAYVNKDGKIVAMQEVVSVFVTGEVKVNDDKDLVIVLADDTEYKLERVEKKSVDAFVNGKAAGKASVEKADEVTLAVELSGKYVDELYSISTWKAEKTVKMTEALVEKLAEDDILNGAEFVMNDDDEIDTDEFVLVGATSLDKIEEDDIVTYYVADKKIVKVEVGTKTVEGKVTKVTKDDKFVINGEKYAVALAANAEAKGVALGDEGTFYLNAAGKIAEFEGVSKVEDYAIIVLDMGTDSTGAYDSSSSIKVKMITADGKETVYTVEKDYAKTLNVKDYTANTIVTYSVDKDGEIDGITTKAAIKVSGEMDKKGMLDGEVVADEVVVFVYDAEEDEYTVADLKAVPVKEALGNTYYVLNEDEIEVIILDSAAGDDEESVYGVVVDYAKVENDDEEEVYEVEMLVEGKAAEYKTTKACEMKDAAVLYKLVFDGSDIKEFAEVKAYAEATTVAAVKNGNIKLEGAAKYEEVSADVVVYEVNKDGDMVKATIDDVEEDDVVIMYQLDEDDENGVDVVIIL